MGIHLGCLRIGMPVGQVTCTELFVLACALHADGKCFINSEPLSVRTFWSGKGKRKVARLKKSLAA